MTRHVVLLGDSVFDNRAYTNSQPDVAAHLRSVVPKTDKVTLVAVDGSTTTSFGAQLGRAPKDATHWVLSIGGNDALMNIELLNAPAKSIGDALDMLGAAVDSFEESYCNLIGALLHAARLGSGKPALIVCTIYNGNLGGIEAKRARTALMMFNDVIVRAAATRHVDIIDLRTVCTEEADYANPIEPSGQGGLKIARAIASALEGASPRRSTIHTG